MFDPSRQPGLGRIAFPIPSAPMSRQRFYTCDQAQNHLSNTKTCESQNPFYSGVNSIVTTRVSIFPFRLFRLNYFFALSRTPHALLDLAAPGLAALLSLGMFPSLPVFMVGFVTAFAGYTAVYALNDLVDFRVDRNSMQGPAVGESNRDLDSIFVRHPLVKGLISYREALIWALFWSVLAMTGAYWLNPFCLVIFLLGATLEIVYCALLKITWLRSIVSGFVKTSGPMAAVFAVTPHPPALFLACLFIWFFFWEIGGQNIPNDLTDVESDREIQAKTVPVRFGVPASIRIIVLSLVLACTFSIALCFLLPENPGWIYPAGLVLSGIYCLLLPAGNLLASQSTGEAFSLFNRASYYPLALLLILAISFLIR